MKQTSKRFQARIVKKFATKCFLKKVFEIIS